MEAQTSCMFNFGIVFVESPLNVLALNQGGWLQDGGGPRCAMQMNDGTTIRAKRRNENRCTCVTSALKKKEMEYCGTGAIKRRQTERV